MMDKTKNCSFSNIERPRHRNTIDETTNPRYINVVKKLETLKENLQVLQVFGLTERSIARMHLFSIISVICVKYAAI